MHTMSKTRILLADDHAVVRTGIRNALKELPNLEVIGEVGDGPALLAALDQTRPDCLLIDVPTTMTSMYRDYWARELTGTT
jgi:DNA-binding NarL/FixJ family response regulator